MSTTVVSVLVVDLHDGMVDWGLLPPQPSITREDCITHHQLGKDSNSKSEVKFY